MYLNIAEHCVCCAPLSFINGKILLTEKNPEKIPHLLPFLLPASEVCLGLTYQAPFGLDLICYYGYFKVLMYMD